MQNKFILSIALLCCLLLGLNLLAPRHLLAQEGKEKKKTEKKTEKSEKKEKKKEEGKKEEKKEKKKEAPPVVVKPPSLGKLLAEAQDMLQLGDNAGAARALYMVHYYYPEDKNAEPSLWQAAYLQKEFAQSSKIADWEKVLDRFRRYVSYYPKSPKAAEAYLELGKTYQAMHYYREAQAYFKLFMERYPDSPLVLQAMRWYRNSMLRAGQEGEAEKVFHVWQKSADAAVRQMGEAGLGNLKSIKGDYQGALNIYQKIMTAAPDQQVADPEILRYAGIANLRLDKTEVGREQLYHYLTLAGMVAERTDVLLELAESYFRTEDYQSANKLYRQIIEEGDGSERAVLFSNLRVAQYLDNPEITLAKWQRHNDLKDEEGDKPYLAILEKSYRDPIAQDARFGMFQRYQARAELEKAYEVGRNFLRNATPEAANALQGKRVGHILLYLVEELLKAKKYLEIHELYVSEYRHIKDFPNAKLQIMIGQAMEALGLYEPAATFYYLAMKWPMTEQEKTELYFRRAEVYLAAKDYEAADRLLTYLAKTYEGKPEAGQVAYYTAKLSAARGQIDKAHDAYGQTMKEPTPPAKQVQAADEDLGLMVQEARLEQAEAVLAKGVAGALIAPEAHQVWLLRIGNGWRGKRNLAKAQAVYQKGLAQGLPDKGDAVQELHLYLGDVFFAQGDKEQGVVHYKAAQQGENPQWQKMADERLTQHDLDTEMAAMKKGSAQ